MPNRHRLASYVVCLQTALSHSCLAELQPGYSLGTQCF